MGPDEDVTLLKKRRWWTEQPSTATTTAVTTRQLSIFSFHKCATSFIPLQCQALSGDNTGTHHRDSDVQVMRIQQ
jgi:hypothetical protein